MDQGEITTDDLRISRMWKWRRRMAIASLAAIFLSGTYMFYLLGTAAIAPTLLSASGPLLAWWFGVLFGIVSIYIAGATAADVSNIIKSKAGG